MKFEMNEVAWCSHHDCFVTVFSPELSPVNTIGCRFPRNGATQYIPDIYLHKINETSLKMYKEAVSYYLDEEVEEAAAKHKTSKNTWDDAIAHGYWEWIK